MIFVDPAVGSNQFVKELGELGILAQHQHLEFGDLTWVGRDGGDSPLSIGVEFKELAEAVGSLRDGRLQGHQVPGLVKTYAHSYLVIEGLLKNDGSGYLYDSARNRRMQPQMTEDEWNKRLLSIQTPRAPEHRHPHVVLLPNRTRTLNWLMSAYRWWTDLKLDEHTSPTTYYERPTMYEVSLFRQMIMKLPGIGLKTSLAVEEFFKGDLDYALHAGSGTWASITGIGAKTAVDLQPLLRKLRGDEVK